MSDESTTRMISKYMEEADSPLFLSGEFQTPAENIHDTEKVEIDVQRDDEDVAIVITDLSIGPRSNESNIYTNKAFTPPIYKEEGPIQAYDLIRRMAGQNPFDNPDFGANALLQSFTIFRRLERKIRRAIELQASQVLQTGQLNLTDQAGNILYTLDFQPKSTHFPNASVTWPADGASGTPIGDLESLATIVRRDGKKQPKKLIFGTTAMQRFEASDEVKEKLDNRRIELGRIAPVTRGQGATFRGTVWIGHYEFEMWMYDGFFRAPGDGAYSTYVGDEKVIMLSEGARLDLTFGSIPQFVRPEGRALPFLPARLSSEDRGLALTTNSWLTPNGEALMVSAGTRPLTIPTAIDTFGCLDINQA